MYTQDRNHTTTAEPLPGRGVLRALAPGSGMGMMLASHAGPVRHGRTGATLNGKRQQRASAGERPLATRTSPESSA